MYVYIYIYIYMCVCACKCIYIYTYIYIHIYICIHMYFVCETLIISRSVKWDIYMYASFIYVKRMACLSGVLQSVWKSVAENVAVSCIVLQCVHGSFMCETRHAVLDDMCISFKQKMNALNLLPLHVAFDSSEVLQSVAECCRVLQCVAVCCSVLQCVAVCCSINVLANMHAPNLRPRDAASDSSCVLQCVALCCSMLQCVAMCCSSPLVPRVPRVVCCSLLQSVAVWQYAQ